LSRYYSKASLDAETAENIIGSLTVARLETKSGSWNQGTNQHYSA